MIGLPTENDKSAMRDVGFTLADEIEEGLIAEPIWRDPLVVGVPAKPPSLAFKGVPLDDVLNYRWYFVIPIYEGCSQQLERLAAFGTCAADRGRARGHTRSDTGAGGDIGFSSTAYIEACKITDVIARRLAGRSSCSPRVRRN